MSRGEQSGRVFLVGAGPGDPDLMTLRGRNALRCADAVVYDALAAPELLDLAPPDALRINVGKRGHDPPTRPQEETTALLLRLAREGKTVVRLKGGDPFIFGRGGEECSALAAAGVPFEVVPGISSVVGALAYAGIPVTDRRHGASFAVVTGHKDPTRVSAETRWGELATSADTLVILMAIRNLETILERVMAGGRSPETPAAAVMEGTLPSQRVVEAPLGELARRVAEAGLEAPSVVVIGDVVRLRPSLAWFEKRPLFGKRVLVTRAAEQAGELMTALRDAGAGPVSMPMIRIAPPEDWAPVDAALAELESYDALLVTSANAIRCFAARARERGRSLADVRWTVACVGPGTAEATRSEGLSVDVMPDERHDAEGLLEAVGKRLTPAGRRFLLPRAVEGRDVLAEGLRAAGAQAEVISVYRTLAADADADLLRGLLVRGELDALTFTSPSTVRRFAALLDAPAREAARRCLLAAIGPVTAQALREEGFSPDVVPTRAGPRELVAALVRASRDQCPGGSS
jgi:uroporphyrinogen III methyltransferase/synthase